MRTPEATQAREKFLATFFAGYFPQAAPTRRPKIIAACVATALAAEEILGQTFNGGQLQAISRAVGALMSA